MEKDDAVRTKSMETKSTRMEEKQCDDQVKNKKRKSLLLGIPSLRQSVKKYLIVSLVSYRRDICLGP